MTALFSPAGCRAYFQPKTNRQVLTRQRLNCSLQVVWLFLAVSFIPAQILLGIIAYPAWNNAGFYRFSPFHGGCPELTVKSLHYIASNHMQIFPAR